MIARARKHMPNGTPMVWMAFHDDQLAYIDHGEGPGFTDIDGFGYLDFNASDMAMFCGHANPAIVAAIAARAARSTQFLLPTEESVAVAEELARRYPVGQRAVVRAQAPHRCGRLCADRRNAHPADPDLAGQPRHLGGPARRRAHRLRPGDPRGRGPLRHRVRRAAGTASLNLPGAAG
jgi:hypothetical protein